MGKEQREPFSEFAKLGHGIPMLVYFPKSTTASVHWGDGTLDHYAEFSSALSKNDMQRDLHEIFQRHAKEGAISRRTVLSYGGVHGALTNGPIPLAMEITDSVRDHFVRALDIVAARIREGRTYLDELRAEGRRISYSRYCRIRDTPPT
jgi:hypothetical protein